MSLNLIKRLVLSLSALLEVLGFILTAYGIFFLNTTQPAENFSGGLFLILGCIIMIVAIFGFVAAIREAVHSLLMYFGVLLLMIRIQVMLVDVASQVKDEIEEKIRNASAFRPIFVPDPETIFNLEILINWLVVIKIVCWLIIVTEGVEAVFVGLLYRSIRRSRLTENTIPSQDL